MRFIAEFFKKQVTAPKRSGMEGYPFPPLPQGFIKTTLTAWSLLTAGTSFVAGAGVGYVAGKRQNQTSVNNEQSKTTITPSKK